MDARCLSEREIETLSLWDDGSYTCLRQRGVCNKNCEAQHEGLIDRVERIVAARVAEALAAQGGDEARLCIRCGRGPVSTGLGRPWCTRCGSEQDADTAARLAPREADDGPCAFCGRTDRGGLLRCDHGADDGLAERVIDAIEETFLGQLPSKALSYCAQEDVNAGLDAMRERFGLEGDRT